MIIIFNWTGLEPKMSEERKLCICEAVSITMDSNNHELEKYCFAEINGGSARHNRH